MMRSRSFQYSDDPSGIGLRMMKGSFFSFSSSSAISMTSVIWGGTATMGLAPYAICCARNPITFALSNLVRIGVVVWLSSEI